MMDNAALAAAIAARGISDGSIAWLFVGLSALALFAVVAVVFVWRKTARDQPRSSGHDYLTTTTDELRKLAENERELVRTTGRMETSLEEIRRLNHENKVQLEGIARRMDEHERTSNERYQDTWQRLNALSRTGG